MFCHQKTTSLEKLCEGYKMLLWHNWASEYVLKLSYDTKIFTSHLRLEQRRGLRTSPLLELSLVCLFLSSAKNFIGQKKEDLYVPFEPEAFIGTRGGIGTHTITITSDISDCFILKNASNLYLCDIDGNIAEIVSLVGSLITLDADLGGTSNEFFPCLKCFAKDINQSYPTSETLEASLTLEQIKE